MENCFKCPRLQSQNVFSAPKYTWYSIWSSRDYLGQKNHIRKIRILIFIETSDYNLKYWVKKMSTGKSKNHGQMFYELGKGYEFQLVYSHLDPIIRLDKISFISFVYEIDSKLIHPPEYGVSQVDSTSVEMRNSYFKNTYSTWQDLYPHSTFGNTLFPALLANFENHLSTELLYSCHTWSSRTLTSFWDLDCLCPKSNSVNVQKRTRDAITWKPSSHLATHIRSNLRS